MCVLFFFQKKNCEFKFRSQVRTQEQKDFKIEEKIKERKRKKQFLLEDHF